MPFQARYPSVFTLTESSNEKLFICAAGSGSQKSALYDLENDQWTKLKDMNHRHCGGGICEWEERGNKVIVAAGWNDNRFVEEYDMHKDKWMDLPKLKWSHDDYPALLTKNNILFCIGGLGNHAGWGCIELYDPRSPNHWIWVDTVHHYFDFDP